MGSDTVSERDNATKNLIERAASAINDNRQITGHALASVALAGETFRIRKELEEMNRHLRLLADVMRQRL